MWIPPSVRGELVDQREQHKAHLLEMMEEQGKLKQWRRELREIDPYLDLVKAHETADAPGLKPGFYHVMRHNPGAPPTLYPIQTPDGGFREPDSDVFEMLRRSDMWSGQAVRERERYARECELAKERQQAREREERKDEFNILYKALENPGVLFSDRKGWKNKAGARSEKKAA